MIRIEFLRLKNIMRLRKLPFDWKRMDIIRHHNRGMSGESRKHFICKCICSKILYDAKHTHFTEYDFPNEAVADIYDATANTVIEFESESDRKKEAVKLLQFKPYVREVFVIDIAEFPENDVFVIEREIRNRIGV